MLGAANTTPASAEDVEVWKWLFRFDADQKSWHGSTSTPLERVKLVYEAVKRRSSVRSPYLEGVFKESIVDDLEASMDIKPELTCDKVRYPPTSVIGKQIASPPRPAPSTEMPFLESEKVQVCVHSIAHVHNLKMEWLRERRANGGTDTVSLVQQLIPAGSLERELAKVKESFSEEGGVTVGAEQKVPLICPFTQARMKLPARGASCTHLNAFDLHAWIHQVIRENSPSHYWQCPHCPTQLSLASVYISPLLFHVVEVCSFCFPPNLMHKYLQFSKGVPLPECPPCTFQLS